MPTKVRLGIKGSHFPAELLEPDAAILSKSSPFFRKGIFWLEKEEMTQARLECLLCRMAPPMESCVGPKGCVGTVVPGAT